MERENRLAREWGGGVAPKTTVTDKFLASGKAGALIYPLSAARSGVKVSAKHLSAQLGGRAAAMGLDKVLVLQKGAEAPAKVRRKPAGRPGA
ncbi:hypothetical protein CDAR_461301 [Caerostris darwini]|uniref:Uncharacterized protein n=1 Tax=Caerostris darwini TaxID=1538125 RepID=A0AAV4SDA1_9ARAC|nr:hypothetical protein CDAR_461301 [Caerostris darwini]